MKRVNLLYVFWFLAFLLFLWIMNNLRNQSFRTIFGTAITEVYSINVEYPAIVGERRVQQGDYVKKGDTLLVLFRSEMDKNITDDKALMNQAEVERTAKNMELDKQEELLNAEQNSRKTEINSQIKMVEKELEIQNNLRNSIGESNTKQGSNLKELELAGLKEALLQLNIQMRQQHLSFEVQRQTNNKNYEAKLAIYKNDINYYTNEKYKMIVVAPTDGIVENVFVLPKDMTPQYKELLRINSARPNRVNGFIQESVVLPFIIGDSVSLTSAARPGITARGIIIGNGNNLIEMPMRLRKFIELRVWGRELYIKMNSDNGFYIDEKIIIQIN